MKALKIFSLFVWIFLTSCGGGGSSASNETPGGVTNSGGGYSISLDKSSLQFDAVIGVKPAAQTVTVTFKGDGVLVGYPPGVVPPMWMNVVALSNTATTATFSVAPGALGILGSVNTTLRFVTGNADGSTTKYVDVSVSMKASFPFSAIQSSPKFSMQEGAALPPVQYIHLITDLASQGWKASVVYDPNDVDTWLSIPASGTVDKNGVDIPISVSSTSRGSHSAKIVLKDSSDNFEIDIPVTFDVAPGFQLTGITNKSLTEKSDTSELNETLQIVPAYDAVSGSKITWTISADQPWVSFANSSGDFSKNQSVQINFSSDKMFDLANGDYNVNIRLSISGADIKPIVIPFVVSLNLDPKFLVTGVSGYTIDNATDTNIPAKAFSIKTNLGTAFNKNFSWNAKIPFGWLALVKSTGDTASDNLLKVQLNNSELAKLDNGHFFDTISITPNNSKFPAIDIQVPVDLNLSRLDRIYPYVAYAGRSESIAIYGRGFSNQTSLKVSFGGVLATAVVESDNLIHVKYPNSLGISSVNVSIPTASNISGGVGSLKVIAAPSYQYVKQQIDAAYRHIEFDAERQAVLLSNTGDVQNKVVRMKNVNGTWTTDTFAIANAHRATTSNDGKDVLVAVGSGSNTMVLDLDADSFTLKQSSNAPTNISNYDLILQLINNQTMLISTNQWPSARLYPSYDYFNFANAWGPQTAISRDRSMLLVGNSNSGSDNYSYNLTTNSFTPISLNLTFFVENLVSISGSNEKIVAESNVYDKNFNFLGSLNPVQRADLVAVTPDGKIVYQYDYISNKFRSYNLDQASGSFPVISSDLGFAIDADTFPSAMKVTDDGKAMIVIASKYLYSQIDSYWMYVLPLI